MKKLLLLILLMSLIALQQAFAQTEKGSWLIGAGSSLDFSSENSTYNGSNSTVSSRKSQSFQFSPSGGYFLFDNFVLGLSIPLEFSSSDDDSSAEIDVKDRGIILAPFVRYYFGSARLKPYASFSYGFGRRETTYSILMSAPQGFPAPTREISSNYDQTVVVGEGGVAYFINDSFSLDLSVSYENRKNKYEELGEGIEVSNNKLRFKLGFNLFF